MIQKTNARSIGSITSSGRSILGSSVGSSEQHWGSWSGSKHYSLEVIQHPIRARMCGFGDKDRRPLAPAAVAKMVVRREDSSIVDVDEIDAAFFVVTVDLWSADGKNEMNLVMHPSSTDRYIPAHTSKPRRRVNATSAPLQRAEPSNLQAGAAPHLPSHSAPYPSSNYSFHSSSNAPDHATYPSHSDTPSWSHIVEPRPGLPPIHSFSRSANLSDSTSSTSHWHPESQDRDSPDATPFRNWNSDLSLQSDHNVQNNTTTTHPIPPVPAWSPPPPEGGVSQSRFANGVYVPPPLGVDNTPVYATAPYGPYSHQHSHPLPPPPASQNPYASPVSPIMNTSIHRHAYTRTLVGPLSANACRLLDEHRKPGIFFLFQDLSIRTEGTFRLRMRLMNVGALPAPESGALRVMTDVSPLLAQTFSEPFIVYSAKRFPGVPDTTALSIAFGNQGQKLPLRNRHGSRQESSRPRRVGSNVSEDDSDGT